MKMRLLFTDILCIMLLTISTACNSDIFVEPLPKDIETDITLSPGGDSYSFKIKKKGLSGLSFLAMKSTPTPQLYIMIRMGRSLYGSYSIGDVAKIVYAAPRFSIEFRVSGDKVEYLCIRQHLRFRNLRMVNPPIWRTIPQHYLPPDPGEAYGDRTPGI